MTSAAPDPPDPAPHTGSRPPSDPLIRPTHSADGVDLTLIRWMLSMTPDQRLDTLQQFVRSVERLRGDAGDA